MTGNSKIIQTLYLNTTENPILDNGGFLSPDINWMSWALSCLQLRSVYGNVELYTNDAGKEVLIDLLKLPYTRVNVVLDKIDFPPPLWAYAKLYTYSLQEHPFIHVDGDVFIWRKLKANSKLFVQNIENTDYYYRPVIDRLIRENFLFPEDIQKEIEKDLPFSSINAGVIGGTDLNFFKEYTTRAFEFIKNNKEKISSVDPTNLNMVFEQFFFYCLARHRNIKIISQMEAVIDMSYKKLFNFLTVPYKTTYIHMVGSYKKNVEASILLAKRLRQNYPDYYYRIIDQCKNSGVESYFDYYKSKQFNPSDAVSSTN